MNIVLNSPDLLFAAAENKAEATQAKPTGNR
jgi:hypothetical protein